MTCSVYFLQTCDILALSCFFCGFSLRQTENNFIDLRKIEAETKEKIQAVNAQKVTIVAAFIAQMKVSVNALKIGGLNMTVFGVSACLNDIFVFSFAFEF